MNTNEIFLKNEGDAWFKRNKNALEKSEVNIGIKYFSDFLKTQLSFYDNAMYNILEIGCSNGKNLKYFQTQFPCSISGIDPSNMAIDEMKSFVNDKNNCFKVGTADKLDYASKSFDVVLLGFCMFWVGREFVLQAIAEADRVLKDGGFLLIHDFDTLIPYKRKNVHNDEAYTFKMDYSKLFLSNPQYYLCGKKSFSHANNESGAFDPVVQERVSAWILYKEKITDSYMKG